MFELFQIKHVSMQNYYPFKQEHVHVIQLSLACLIEG